MLRTTGEPIFQLPETIFRQIRKRKHTKCLQDRIVKPLKLKEFWFTQGTLIWVASMEDPYGTPIHMSVQWNDEGTDFKLAHTTVDIFV